MLVTDSRLSLKVGPSLREGRSIFVGEIGGDSVPIFDVIVQIGRGNVLLLLVYYLPVLKLSFWFCVF